jgi:hypothetical protein
MLENEFLTKELAKEEIGNFFRDNFPFSKKKMRQKN